MPKISAPTVGEHHENQLALLLDAAADLLRRGGPEALTLASLAKQVGRSRASLYVYFGSTQDLLVTVCEFAIATWARNVSRAAASASTPTERLARFIGAQVTAAPDPLLDAALRIAGSTLSDAHRERIAQAQVPLLAELLDIIATLGVDPPEGAAFLVQGAIASAHDQVANGADADAVNDATTRFIHAGISQLAARPGGSNPPPAHRPDALATHALPPRGDASALAFARTPSLPLLFASVIRETTGTPQDRLLAPPPTEPVSVVAASMRAIALRRRIRITAAALLGWAVVAFYAGLTGGGSSAAHVALGLAFVGLACAAVPTLNRAKVLGGLASLIAAGAATTSAVAVLGGGQRWTTIIHVVLATGLLIGLAHLLRTAWHSRAIANIQPFTST